MARDFQEIGGEIQALIEELRIQGMAGCDALSGALSGVVGGCPDGLTEWSNSRVDEYQAAQWSTDAIVEKATRARASSDL